MTGANADCLCYVPCTSPYLALSVRGFPCVAYLVVCIPVRRAHFFSLGGGQGDGCSGTPPPAFWEWPPRRDPVAGPALGQRSRVTARRKGCAPRAKRIHGL